ncbi:DUF2442 domain-containing protein (plasmid) [Cyanobacterium sp. IPPAS B-1200]|uniref:DUF2442 domain-containing protein n=1 Tax=Cyanobacterium sp. IPPAS B-1200 TaxID=1562720 RepID=UPI0008525E6A|nr:DUF2442 domain-containing protein [Cyanobacterium sp. IPPAS B-1200]OEJ78419.1 hypothetical protein A5482_13310 [Cyanobacterium sp. IPPAS B-1200]
MNKIHDIQSINFTEREIILTVDQKTYHLPLSEVSKKLDQASEMERKVYKISPSGYGIHWVMIDEDLSIDGLIKLAENLSIPNNSN